MTIDAAIKKYRKLSNSDRTCYPEEAAQIAEWLEELKAYKSDDFTKNLQKLVYMQGYQKAIDDFTEKLKQDVMAITFGLRICDIDRLAEQLKEGGVNDD